MKYIHSYHSYGHSSENVSYNYSTWWAITIQVYNMAWYAITNVLNVISFCDCGHELIYYVFFNPFHCMLFNLNFHPLDP